MRNDSTDTSMPIIPEDDYRVVVNKQGHYRLVRSVDDTPTDWRDTGYYGSKSDCLKFIGQKLES